MSNQTDTIFSKLELECGLEKKNVELEEKIKQLEQENTLLKEKELSRTKLNMEAECACIYTNGSGAYVYGELEQLDKMLSNCAGLKYAKNVTGSGWGSNIHFTSIASARTCLLKNGFTYSYESKTYFRDTTCLYVENWFRGI